MAVYGGLGDWQQDGWLRAALALIDDFEFCVWDIEIFM
jgi:hypothetical protein